MPWIKQNENLYTHSEATFVMVKQSEKWVLIDTRDQSKAIPIDDIFNNPVFLINFENQVVLASHFRGEGANTPSTPAYSFKTEISSGLYRESAGVLAISVLGNKVLTIDSKPSFLCKAWVNFNGIGTVTIRASGNVSSITDNGTGDYTVNFTNAMPDTNYSVNITTGNVSSNFPIKGYVISYSVDNVRVNGERDTVGSNVDSEFMNISVHR